jgi:hypothetical protein
MKHYRQVSIEEEFEGEQSWIDPNGFNQRMIELPSTTHVLTEEELFCFTDYLGKYYVKVFGEDTYYYRWTNFEKYTRKEIWDKYQQHLKDKQDDAKATRKI